MIEVQAVLEARVCGSPAVDGYAHVKPECLETSPTNLWWQVNKPKPDDLDIHIERGADYDGLAGEAGRNCLVCVPRPDEEGACVRLGKGGGLPTSAD